MLIFTHDNGSCFRNRTKARFLYARDLRKDSEERRVRVQEAGQGREDPDKGRPSVEVPASA